ncbi:MAG: hypothetical protein IKB88_04980 [Clostridia bacterium]|nr:hypothetical protein [Clostridia bacterium]
MSTKNFCYCIGGVGTRIAEVAGHLCAANLIEENEGITFIIVDKDDKNGGTSSARQLLNNVNCLSDENKHSATALITSGDNEKHFCKTKLHIDTWDFSSTMKSLSNANYAAAPLETSLTSANTAFASNDGILFDAFYSEKEQSKNTDQGFYGHPSIGALIFKYMIKEGKWDNSGVIQSSDIASPVKNALATNNNNPVKVFIVGSIFGGTGASIFSNLARHIRTSVGDGNKDRVFISGALLLPYFTFGDKKGGGGMIDSQSFYSKTKIALEQYDADENLMKTDTNSDGSFDTLYVCGQEPLHCIGNYSEGGENQHNHFDFVDLAAAYAMTEFMNVELQFDTATRKYSLPARYQNGIYEYRYATGDNPTDIPVVKYENLPDDLHRRLAAMSVFSAYFICRVYLDEKTKEGVFIKERLLTKNEIKNYEKAYATQVTEILDRVYNYCSSFVNLMMDISTNGKDHSNDKSKASYESNYSIFNKEYYDKLNNVIIDIGNGNYTNAANSVNKTFVNTKKRDQVSNYYMSDTKGLKANDVEEHLKNIFDKRKKTYEANQIDIRNRVGDFVHETFGFIYTEITKDNSNK